MSSMLAPKVTVMIPTYNQSGLISDAISSVLNQDYNNLEIIISDDNSSDNTFEIASCFLKDKRIKYYKNSANLGVIENYHNTLYTYATGDWVLNLDGDDFLTDQFFISKAIKIITKNKGIGFVFSDYSIYSENDKSTLNIKNKNFPKIMNGKDFLIRFSTENIHWCHFSIIYNRKKSLELGFYDNSFEARNDWSSFLMLAVGNKVAYIDTIAGSWRRHGVNETGRTDLKKYIDNFVIIHSLRNFINESCVMTKKESVKWSSDMIYKFSCDAIGAYFINREYFLSLIFMKHVWMENKIVAIKITFSGLMLIKLVLSLSPFVYTLAKRLKYS